MKEVFKNYIPQRYAGLVNSSCFAVFYIPYCRHNDQFVNASKKKNLKTSLLLPPVGRVASVHLQSKNSETQISSWSNRAQCCRRLATAETFFERSYVAQAQRHGEGPPANSLHTST